MLVNKASMVWPDALISTILVSPAEADHPAIEGITSRLCSPNPVLLELLTTVVRPATPYESTMFPQSRDTRHELAEPRWPHRHSAGFARGFTANRPQDEGDSMKIGIVGAGVAGVGLLDALARLDPPPGEIVVFDAAPASWRGRPYQPDLDAVRVNAPPARMSMRLDDAGHFERWLQEHGDWSMFHDEGLGVPIVPRRVYGEYLEETAQTAIARLRNGGWRIEVVNEPVTGFVRDGSNVLVTGGGRYHVDHAVLCVGSGSPRDHYGLTGNDGFFVEPYPLADTLTQVRPDTHVAVIGSGLTAVDVAVSLSANGHTGPISFLSRSGVLPFVMQRPVPLEPHHLTPPSAIRLAAAGAGLDDAVALMRAELEDLGEDFDRFAAEILDTGVDEPVTRLKRHIAEIDSPHLGRRLLVMVTRMVGPILWPALPVQHQQMLRAEYFRTINSLTSPMVPHNATIVLELLNSGQLRLHRGVTEIEADDEGGFRITDETVWSADIVVNAVNPPAYTTPQATERLLESLLAAGAAELAPTGGLRTQSGTRRLLVHGHPDPTWHVVGNLAADSLFIATNPTHLAAESASVATYLATRAATADQLAGLNRSRPVTRSSSRAEAVGVPGAAE
ncbi:FAD/NAD(P)-binding protein [Nocardia abscessus]|uniref:FAD/NAD(P)-binding protein n=1 Tax=Nocardia abscessus TaxID=120957 RepID=UPI002456D686|nr:FAD/NAD(P)-binding protein [Nocardia abscessus]